MTSESAREPKSPMAAAERPAVPVTGCHRAVACAARGRAARGRALSFASMGPAGKLGLEPKMEKLRTRQIKGDCLMIFMMYRHPP